MRALPTSDWNARLSNVNRDQLRMRVVPDARLSLCHSKVSSQICRIYPTNQIDSRKYMQMECRGKPNTRFIRMRYIYASIRLLLINIGFSEFNVLINRDMFR